MNVASATIDLLLNALPLQRGMREARQDVERWVSDTETGAGRVGRGFAALAGGIRSTFQGVFQGIGQEIAQVAMRGLSSAGAGVKDAFIGLNSTAEQARAKIQAFTKDSAQTEVVLANIRKEAALTPFSFQEMTTAMGSLMPVAKSANVSIDDLIKQAEILAASNPLEGLEGASFSLREAMTGDFTSIIERFNLSRTTINQLKAEGVPNLEIVRRAMLEMGYDMDLVNQMAQTGAGRWSTLMDSLDTVKISLTQSTYKSLVGALGSVQERIDANLPRVLQFTEAIGARLGAAVASTIDGVFRFAEAWGPALWGRLTQAGALLRETGGILLDLGRYFAFVVTEGDHLNDWATHLPVAVRPLVLLVGEFIANVREIAVSAYPILRQTGQILLDLADDGRLSIATLVQLSPTMRTVALIAAEVFLQVRDYVTGEALPALRRFGSWFREDALPFLTGFAEKVTWMAGIVAPHFGTIATLAGVLGGGFGLVGRAAAILGPLITGLGATIAGLTATFSTAGGGIAGVVAVLGGPLTVALGLVAGAVALLAIAWRNDWGGIQTTLTRWWETVGGPTFALLREWLAERLTAAIRVLADFWSGTLQPAMERVFGWITGTALPAVTRAFMDAWPLITQVVQTFGRYIDEVLWPTLRDVFDTLRTRVLPMLSEAFSVYWGIISGILRGVFEFVRDTVIPGYRTYLGWLGDEGLPRLRQAFEVAWAAIDRALGAVYTFLHETFWPWLQGTAIPWVENVGMPALRRAFEVAWEAIATAVGAAYRFLSETVWPWLRDQAIPWLRDTGLPALRAGFEVAWSGIQTAVSTAYRFFLETVWPWLQDVAIPWLRDTALPTLRSGFETAWSSIQVAVSAVYRFFRDEVWPWLRDIAIPWLQDTALPQLRERFRVVWGDIQAAVGEVVRVWREVVWPWLRDTAFPWLQDVALPALKQAFSVAWAGIQLAVGAVFEFLRDNVWPWLRDTAFPWLQNTALPALLRAFDETWPKIRDAVAGAYTFLKDTVWPWLQEGFRLVKDEWLPALENGFWNVWGRDDNSGIRGAVGAAMGALDRLITNPKEAIKAALLWPFEQARDAAGRIMYDLGFKALNQLQGALNGVWSFGRGVAQAINWISDKLGLGNVIGDIGAAPSILGGYDSGAPSGQPGTMYAAGTEFHPGGPALVSEAGREFVKARGIWQLFEQPTLLNLDRGAQVIPNDATEALLAAGIPGFAGGLNWDAIKDAIRGAGSGVLDFVREWIGKPAGTLADAALGAAGVQAPELPGIMRNFGGALLGKTKGWLVEAVKGWLNAAKSALPTPAASMGDALPGIRGTGWGDANAAGVDTLLQRFGFGRSPFSGADIDRLSGAYGVPEGLILGLLQKESQMGSNAGGLAQYHNYGGITGTPEQQAAGQTVHYVFPDGGTREFLKFGAPAEYLDYKYRFLMGSYYKNRSLEELIGNYYAGPAAFARYGVAATDAGDGGAPSPNGTVQDYINVVLDMEQRLTGLRPDQQAIVIGNRPAPVLGPDPGAAGLDVAWDGWSAPMRDYTVSQEFGRNSFAETAYASGAHSGSDLVGPYGARVLAAGRGTVTGAGWAGGYGNAVTLDHGNALESVYAHLDRILVSVRQLVSRGQEIGIQGTTGHSTGDHLHFEIRRNGMAVNPREYVGFANGGRVTEWIRGVGRETGTIYDIGEAGPEWIVPDRGQGPPPDPATLGGRDVGELRDAIRDLAEKVGDTYHVYPAKEQITARDLAQMKREEVWKHARR